MVRIIVAVVLAAGLFLLNVVLLRLNKKTPVPEGCENLTPDCSACGMKDCAMRGTYEKKKEAGFASKKFYVEPDTRVDDVLAMLPGYNCGGCGNPGCAAMADKLVNGEATPEGCKPCKPEAREQIKKYLAEHVQNA